MQAHYQFTDDEFEKRFHQKTLDPKYFTHEAHLRLAYIHIEKYGEEIAIDNLCQQIRSFATSVGEPDKFNMTLTIAAIKIVAYFMKALASRNFKQLISTEPRLKHGFSNLIKAHYSFNIFNNPDAKNQFLTPDLIAFD